MEKLFKREFEITIKQHESNRVGLYKKNVEL